MPAGSYEAVANVAGAIGAPVQVTVAAGGLAALVADLRVGPVISGVTPAGFVPVELDMELGGVLTSPPEYVLSGSGFGAERGLGRLTYGGCEVPFEAVTRWSDTEIGIDSSNVSDGSCEPGFLDADDLRFVVSTLSGSATSPVSGAYSLSVQWWSEVEDLVEATPASVGVGFQAGFYFTSAGLTVAVDADNGTVQTMAGTPLTTWTTTSGYNHYNVPSFRVVPSSWLPIVLTLDPSADPRVAGGPQRFALRGGSLVVDNGGYVPGSNTFTGSVLAADGVTPMPDDGVFGLRFFSGWACAYERELIAQQALDIAPDGTWSASVTLPDEQGIWVALTYDGVVTTCGDLWPVN
ncbi:MAG: hypothetical protein LC667_08630 [Thioalkalivibrio sp.]|nr:hypothetical protein [Thioalkalivibrio sp.]